MANLDGIIPLLPSGGSYSNRTSTKNGREFNLFQFDPVAANQAIFDKTGEGSTYYNTPGYFSGYGDPNDPSSNYQFATRVDPYMLPDKITPSQRTQTVAQTVGPAQFSVNGSTSTQGVGTNQTSSPFSAAAPSVGQSTAPATSTPQGFYFGSQFMPGSFGNSNPNQSTPFYSAQPNQPQQPNQGLGMFSQVDPKIQALIQSR